MPEGDKPWVVLMRTGYFTDMKSRSLRVELADLIRIQTNYNPNDFKAPLFLDSGWHTNTNGDAAGWVDELRVNGEFLEAQVVDVPSNVKFAVADGRRRQVSVELDIDDAGQPVALSRVALLGASPPAITGLPQLDPAAFEDGATLKFSKPSKSGGHETAWVLMNKEGEMPEQGSNNPNPPAGDTAQMVQMNESITKLTKRLDKSEAAFAQSQKENAALTGRVEVAEGRASRLTTEADKAQVAAFTKGLVTEGKLPPGLNTPELAEFMAGLDNEPPTEGQAGTLMFTAPAGTDGVAISEAVSPRAFFTKWLGGLPRLVQEGHQFTAAPAGAGDPKDKYTQLGEAIANAGGDAGKKKEA